MAPMDAGMHRRAHMEEMMDKMRRLAVLPIAMLVLAACQAAETGGTATRPASATAPAASASEAAVDITNVVCVGEATTYLDWLNGDLEPDVQDPIEDPGDATGDLLETIQENGVLRISTDANYEPQSFRDPDGSWVGFDIDVGTEIASRLGVEAEFQHQDWDIITAGSWSERWDISVGSMTITTPRKELFSFTQPYYYTPADIGASERSGITSVDDLPFELPTEAEPVTRPTDANCIEEITAGRPEFDLFITSGTVIDAATAAGQPVVRISDPLYQENLAVAIDKAGPAHEALLFEIDRIIGEMHEDGTLTDLSEEWFGEDLTKDPSGS
jgi:polar amino acid transport system substrate-binding protein